MNTYPFDAFIFDLDGVITKTALVHGRSWKKMFDDYLRFREKRDGEPFHEFTHDIDYLTYVDGKPRYNGVKSFLKSRGIELPMGEPTDPSENETICALGNRKNLFFNEIIKKDGVEVYPSTIELIKTLKNNNVRIGVASSSKNCKIVLESAGIDHLFETRVDGMVSVEFGLKGKPEGDIFVRAARNLGATPLKSVVIEDAKSGVMAGRNGGFGLVIGVAREKNAAVLMRNGADVVVRDLSDMTIDWIVDWFHKKPKPFFSAWEECKNVTHIPRLPHKHKTTIMVSPYNFRSPQSAVITEKKLVFFLNYDGTLMPIKDRPSEAVLDDDMKNIVLELSRIHTVAIISGRQREELQSLVGIENIFYASNHGFDIAGPGYSIVHPKAKKLLSKGAKVRALVSKAIGNIPGILIEEKKYITAIHYRLVSKKNVSQITETVNSIIQNNPKFRLLKGKQVYEILPNVDWGKGNAIRWLMKTFKLPWSKASVFYIGDDITDEFAFRTIRTRGTGIVVSEESRESAAHFQLSSPEEVKKLLRMIIQLKKN
ncbi:MAG: trehalose-phosphatase [Candidatus Omnitrophica bacterium]|nr:trehalose-phosphatase [Candidatus Omnitrophota bacterium]